MNYAAKLNPFLGESYKAKVLNKQSTDAVAGRLVAEIQADAEFAKYVTSAQSKFGSVASMGNNQQCFVSKVHAEFLRSVLERFNG